MKKLMTIEWMKLKRLMTMKIILLIYAVAVPTVYLLFSLIEVGPFAFPRKAYLFPDAYHMIAWTATWFNLMVGVIIIVFTTNEIKFKTQRQNLIDGLSKRDIIVSKFMVVVGLSIAVTLYTFLVGMIIGLLHGDTAVFDGIEFIGVYFVSTLGYFSFAFFFANLVRLPALAITIYIFSTFIEMIVGLIVAQQYYQFFPLSTFRNMIPFPWHLVAAMPTDPDLLSTPVSAALGSVYIACFFVISYWVIKQRDI